jgi:hypothetical protein
MAPGYGGQIEKDGGGGIASDNVFPFGQLDVAIVREEPIAHSGYAPTSRPINVCSGTAERVSEAVRRSHETRPVHVVTEHRPDLANKRREGRLGDKRGRPYPLMDLALRDRSGAVADEQTEYLECLGREMDRLISSQELTAAAIEHEIAEPHNHWRPKTKPTTF